MRVTIAPLPNVQPVTDTLILITLGSGAGYGLPIAVVTMVVSNLVLGFGLWTVPQIIAYAVVVLTTALAQRWLHVNQTLFGQLALSVFAAFLYGLIVSLGMVVISQTAFIAYYLNGVLFDGYHAVGNVLFYPLLRVPLARLCTRYLEKNGSEANG